MSIDLIDTKPDIRRTSPEVIEKILSNVVSQSKLHPLCIFILAFIAGGIICYGAAIGSSLRRTLHFTRQPKFCTFLGSWQRRSKNFYGVLRVFSRINGRCFIRQVVLIAVISETHFRHYFAQRL